MSCSPCCMMRADDVNTSKHLYSVNGIPVSKKLDWNSWILTKFYECLLGNCSSWVLTLGKPVFPSSKPSHLHTQQFLLIYEAQCILELGGSKVSLLKMFINWESGGHPPPPPAASFIVNCFKQDGKNISLECLTGKHCGSDTERVRCLKQHSAFY